MNNSVLRLFKAVPITKKGKSTSEKLLKETIKKGFIFSPEVIHNYSEKDLIKLIGVVEKEVGLSADKMNSSFHKSWKKIREASIEQLVMEQIIHYITTYGFERMGIYDESSVYIPCEELKIPRLNVKKILLTVIKGYTKGELRIKILDLLKSGIALGEDTKKDVIDVATFVELDEYEINNIRNKEVRTALYDYFGLFPEDPIEFLRYIIYKSTNKTLLIKDRATIEDIKSKDNLHVLGLLTKYRNKYGLERLAEIFYRFKPLFLAFRTNSKLKSIVNRIRKLADRYHKPMKEDYLNSITAKIKQGRVINVDKLIKELSRVNVFRKIRLAYALKFRTKEVESILYRIRNGKGYATTFDFSRQKTAGAVLDEVLGSIVEDIKPNVKGKKIYIPEHMNYTLPSTEKQFTGDFPSGTYVSIPKDMVFGIHWENVDGHRIDLDLSLIDKEGYKLGWDGGYRSEGNKILFSGDITDARKPKGASELFYVERQQNVASILMVNYFNFQDFDKEIEVPFKILVAKEKVKRLNENYMVNPNNVLSVAKTKINQRQKILGLLTTTPKECRFYFTETYLGNSITSSASVFSENARRYLFDFYENTISLNELLEQAGAKIVTEGKFDIDLSPEKLVKDTILNLVRK